MKTAYSFLRTSLADVKLLPPAPLRFVSMEDVYSKSCLATESRNSAGQPPTFIPYVRIVRFYEESREVCGGCSWPHEEGEPNDESEVIDSDVGRVELCEIVTPLVSVETLPKIRNHRDRVAWLRSTLTHDVVYIDWVSLGITRDGAVPAFGKHGWSRALCAALG